jgi:hypothetical protein
MEDILWDARKAALNLKRHGVSLRDANANSMKKKRKTDPDMLPEYDFSKGIRGYFQGRVGPKSKIIIEHAGADLPGAKIPPRSAAARASKPSRRTRAK